jgi:hypothetical protein
MGDPAAAAAAVLAQVKASEGRVATAPLAAVAPARPVPVSPMASSVMRSPGDPVQPATPVPWNQPPAPGLGQTPAPHSPSPSPPPTYAPGTMVLVHWSNGNRYPGTVMQAVGAQVLVAFPDGQQHWVDVRYVSGGS